MLVKHCGLALGGSNPDELRGHADRGAGGYKIQPYVGLPVDRVHRLLRGDVDGAAGPCAKSRGPAPRVLMWTLTVKSVRSGR